MGFWCTISQCTAHIATLSNNRRDRKLMYKSYQLIGQASLAVTHNYCYTTKQMQINNIFINNIVSLLPEQSQRQNFFYVNVTNRDRHLTQLHTTINVFTLANNIRDRKLQLIVICFTIKQNIQVMFASLVIRLFSLFFQSEQCFFLTTNQPGQCFGLFFLAKRTGSQIES